MIIIWQLVPDQMHFNKLRILVNKDYSEMFQAWYVEPGTSK